MNILSKISKLPLIRGLSENARMGLVIVVVASVALTLWVGTLLGGFHPTKKLLIGFETAGGIGNNSPVNYNGVLVGEVTSSNIISSSRDKPYHVIFTSYVDRRLDISRDSEVLIKSIGIMGEKSLNIVPGNPESGPLKKGEVLRGVQPLDFSDILKRGQNIAKNSLIIMDGIHEIKDDEEFVQSVKNTFSHFQALLRDIRVIRTETDEDLKHFRGNLSELYAGLDTDFSQISTKFQSIRSSIENVKSENKEDLAAIKENMDLAAQHFAGYNKIIEEKGILFHLKIPKEIKEQMKSPEQLKREKRKKRLKR